MKMMHIDTFKNTGKLVDMGGTQKIVYECKRCKYSTLNELEWCPKCMFGLEVADV